MTFDWCSHNDCRRCPGSYRRFYIERNKIVHTDELVECDCLCHKKKSKK